MEVMLIQNLLRLGVVALFVAMLIVWKWIVDLIGNKRFHRFARKILIAFAVVIVARIAAAFIDSYVGFEIGIASIIVSYGWYGYLLSLLYRLYRRLQADHEIQVADGLLSINPKYVDKQRVSTLIDELFDELRGNIKKTAKLESDLAKHV